MAKWEIKPERIANIIYVRLLRDGSCVGAISGTILEPASGPKYLEATSIRIAKEHQREYMREHKKVKMGEALGSELLKMLKKEGISHIHSSKIFPPGKRFVERSINTGIIEKTPEGFLKINWEKLPATEETKMGIIRKMRTREIIPARALRRLRSIFRRTRPRY